MTYLGILSLIHYQFIHLKYWERHSKGFAQAGQAPCHQLTPDHLHISLERPYLFIVHNCKQTQLLMLLLHMCVYMYLHFCVSTGVRAFRSQRSILGAIPCEPSTLISETRLCLDWLASKPQEPTCLSLPCAGVANTCHHTWIFHMEYGN